MPQVPVPMTKMKGDLDIDPKFTKGTRFVLDLHS